MGIRDFSKVFNPSRTLTFKDLKGKCLAIDAYYEIYRASLGTKSISTLTDASGRSTVYINVILSLVLSLKKNQIDQIWIFDPCQNPAKADELLKRHKKKQEAECKLADLLKQPSFSDSEDETPSSLIIDSQSKAEIKEEVLDDIIISKKPKAEDKESPEDCCNKQNVINALEKRCFSINQDIINDVKLILTTLNIKYVEAPSGFEAEQIAAYLSATNQVDGVFSDDTDTLPFGAKVVYKRDKKNKKKQLLEYTQADVISQIRHGLLSHDLIEKKSIKNRVYWSKNITLTDLRKICVILGSDFSPKTQGIGPKTIFKNYENVDLTDKQKEAMLIFAAEPDCDIETYNFDKVAFVNDKRDELIEWLVQEKSFSKARVKVMFEKV